MTREEFLEKYQERTELLHVAELVEEDVIKIGDVYISLHTLEDGTVDSAQLVAESRTSEDRMNPIAHLGHVANVMMCTVVMIENIPEYDNDKAMRILGTLGMSGAEGLARFKNNVRYSDDIVNVVRFGMRGKIVVAIELREHIVKNS